MPAKAGERRARIGKRVHADAEPRDAVAPRDAYEAEEQDHGDLQRVEVLEHAEVEHHDHADEHLEEQDELPLRDQVGLACLVNQLRDLPHRGVHRQIPQLNEDHHPEREPQRADEESAEQEAATVDALELDGAEIGQHQIGFAPRVTRRRLGSSRLGGRRRLHGMRHGRQQNDEQKRRDRGNASEPWKERIEHCAPRELLFIQPGGSPARIHGRRTPIGTPARRLRARL